MNKFILVVFTDAVSFNTLTCSLFICFLFKSDVGKSILSRATYLHVLKK